MLSRLPRPTQLLLGGLLAAAGASYGAVLMLAYAQVTEPNSVRPDFQRLDAVFFGQGKPVGLIEQLLEATAGPLNRAGTMRPAFTDESIDWESLTQNRSAEQRAALAAEREGERLALLAWVRSGPSREAYEADAFRLVDPLAVGPITAKYLASGEPSADVPADTIGSTRMVRIRSILTDRCVSCHGENGRHEQARWLPLETFEDIERKCRPEVAANKRPRWLIAALSALLPLALLMGPLFFFTSTPSGTRRFLTLLPLAALAVAAGCWLLGQPGTHSIYGLLAAAAVAALGILLQIIGCLADLFTKHLQPPRTSN